MQWDGQLSVLADRFEGRRLNSSNDGVMKSDGTIWVTDPPYGIHTDYEGGKQDATLPHDIVADLLLWQAGDAQAWSERLASAQVEYVPPRPTILRDGRRLVLLRDPDGHLLQVQSVTTD